MTKKNMWFDVKGEVWDKHYELKSDLGVIIENLLDKLCLRRTESVRRDVVEWLKEPT